MPNIHSQADCRKVRDLLFCYLCGIEFQDGDEANHDHVPPTSIFAKEDRNFPIKLKTHKAGCHSPLNLDDEIIGQLVGLIHGRVPAGPNDRLNIAIAEDPDTGKTTGVFQERNVEYLLRRWVQGFHAALYKSHLSPNAKWAIQGPFPFGKVTDHRLVAEPIKGKRSTNRILNCRVISRRLKRVTARLG